MDSGELPPERFPGKEHQGSKSSPLKIKKDSRKISKKPPVPLRPPLMEARSRAPVVIYEVPCKRIIVYNPQDFMSVVQRLTGRRQPSSSSSYSSSSAASSSSSNLGASSSRDVPMADINQSGAVTQAARYASIDRVMRANPNGNQNNQRMSNRVKRQVGLVNEMGLGNGVEMTENFRGILSPGSSSFSPVQTNFFPPITADPSTVNFFPYLSPHGNTSFFEGDHFLTGPSTSVSQPEESSANFFHDLSTTLHGNRSFDESNHFLTGPSTSVSPTELHGNTSFMDDKPFLTSPSTFVSPTELHGHTSFVDDNPFLTSPSTFVEPTELHGHTSFVDDNPFLTSPSTFVSPPELHGNTSFVDDNPFLTSPSTFVSPTELHGSTSFIEGNPFVSPTELHGNTSFMDDNPFLTSPSTFVSQTYFQGNTSFIEGNPFLASSSTFVEPTEPDVDLFDTFFDL